MFKNILEDTPIRTKSWAAFLHNAWTDLDTNMIREKLFELG